MRYEDTDWNWATTGDSVGEEDDDDCLDEYELSRLQYFAEHPEMADPLIWTLPEASRGRGRKR